MAITIKEEGVRFGVRVGAIIFNKDLTKIFMQRQKDNDYYMFPGGRLDLLEDTKTAMERELQEELNLREEVFLKIISESFIQFPKGKYHELGYYFITMIDEDKYDYKDNEEYNSLDEENDGESKFRWINISELSSYNIMPNYLKEKLINNELTFDKSIEHIVYKEFE